MRSIYLKLRELVPELAIVSELLRNNLYNPVVAGQPIKMVEIQGGVRNTSLLSRIEEAIEEGHGDTAVRGAIIELDEADGEVAGVEAEGTTAERGADEMDIDDDDGSKGDEHRDGSLVTEKDSDDNSDGSVVTDEDSNLDWDTVDD